MAHRALISIVLIQVPLRCLATPCFKDIPPHVASLSDVDYWDDNPTATRSCQLGSSSSAQAADNLVYQILDGQIQVAAETVSDHTQASPSTASSSTAKHSARDGGTTIVTQEVTITSSITLTRTITTHTGSSSTGTSTSNPDVSSFITSVAASALTEVSVSAVQSVSGTAAGSTAGFVVTQLDSSQHIQSAPLLSSIASATGQLSLAPIATLTAVQSNATAVLTSISVDNIFQAIATDAPPAQISRIATHPVNGTNIEFQRQTQKVGTNKFYTNFFLGLQNSTVFLFPYSVAWSRGNGLVGSWGLSVSHTESDQYVNAPPKYDTQTGLRIDAGEWAYYINPLGIQSIILSANELTSVNASYPGLSTEAIGWSTVQVNLFAPGWTTPTIRFPLAQGASFITANYSGSTPLIQTGVGFKNYTYGGAVGNAGSTFKYRMLMNETNETWLIYITPDRSLSPKYAVNSFTFTDSFNLQGPSGFNGLIQVAKVPKTADNRTHTDYESLYDNAAGAYAADVSISGQVNDDVGTYTFKWTKAGQQSCSLLMFALPHHVSSFDASTRAGLTDLQLQTTVKGTAIAVVGDSWTLVEDSLPIDMTFDPWSPTSGSCSDVSDAAKQQILAAGSIELTQNISANTDVQSFYYDGKALAKYAAIVYTLYNIADNASLAQYGLQQLKEAFAFHVNGHQMYPLVYDEHWGGVVSQASYLTGNSGTDFGNTYYNDHHFHYGYFVYAAAVIGYLDATWLDADTNKAWVNTLIRDYANPIDSDPYFPFSRMFDWYHGHSWASGLFGSDDGNNQESSSEDTMASYALKMWGRVVGDTHMMARGNLMLAIQARALQSYYLYESTNAIEPARFVGNKAAGILFENKIDHTTYFGAQPEFIQGIHMIPIMPFTPFIRPAAFVQQEWDAYFGNHSNGVSPYIDGVEGGWRGILEADYALVNPTDAYRFFDNSTGTFDAAYLDDGASLTWYLAFTAALKEARA